MVDGHSGLLDVEPIEVQKLCVVDHHCAVAGDDVGVAEIGLLTTQFDAVVGAVIDPNLRPLRRLLQMRQNSTLRDVGTVDQHVIEVEPPHLIGLAAVVDGDHPVAIGRRIVAEGLDGRRALQTGARTERCSPCSATVIELPRRVASIEHDALIVPNPLPAEHPSGLDIAHQAAVGCTASCSSATAALSVPIATASSTLGCSPEAMSAAMTALSALRRPRAWRNVSQLRRERSTSSSSSWSLRAARRASNGRCRWLRRQYLRGRPGPGAPGIPPPHQRHASFEYVAEYVTVT